MDADMSEEENYLDKLLKAIEFPENVENTEEIHTDDIVEETYDNEETVIDNLEDIPEVPDIELALEDIPEIEEEEFALGDIPEIAEEEPVLEDIPETEEEEFALEDIPEIAEEEPVLEDIPETEEEEFALEDIPEIAEEEPVLEDIPKITEEELVLEDIPEIAEEEPVLEDIPELPNISETEAETEEKSDIDIGDLEMPDITEDELQLSDELTIDGLDKAIESETELEMAGELNIDELDLNDETDLTQDIDLFSDIETQDSNSDDKDDNLDDVLSMLDDDAELAEINDMLKKSDNNEPLVEDDDMMNLLSQMADDEAESVNAGVTNIEEDDGGVPLPEMPLQTRNGKSAGDTDSQSDTDSNAKEKKPGKFGKFFNMLTEDLVPEPTQEELEAEKAAKEAKKQENLTKKEEEKQAKAEEKKVKAEEKEAAKKAKAEVAAQKKKEKQAAKDAKEAAKKAKQKAEGPVKRIPPKKIAAAAAFGITVGGAVILSANILSAQGYLQSARKAYYDNDYKTVYLATYDMDLDTSESDGLIKARSKTILKIQRRYDSYQNYLKMGREIEALDALIQGVIVYDYINAEAQQYGVLDNVEAIRTEILNTLWAKYGLDEAAVRELAGNQEALSYTMALNDIVSR